MDGKYYNITDLKCPNCEESDLGIGCIEDICSDIYNGAIAECPECGATISLDVIILANTIALQKKKNKKKKK